MCGATAAQTELQQQQAEFYKNLSDAYEMQFGSSETILDSLRSQFMPILQAGPNQQGFNPAELQDLQTQAIEGTGTNYAQASKALQENQAATTGGEFLPAGATTQLQQELATSAAAEKSQEQQQITQASYAQGHANWAAAANELNDAAQMYNPLGYAGAATSSGEAAGTTANQIAQASNSVWGSVLGALGGVAGAAVGNPSAITSLWKKIPGVSGGAGGSYSGPATIPGYS
jgi:hypothetical protein